MARRPAVAVMAVLGAFLIPGTAQAGGSRRTGTSASALVQSTPETGILLDRIDGPHLRTWKAIWRIVSAKNKAGRILHPRLYGLWNEVAASGHTVYIELSDHASMTKAGRFLVESVDPAGCRHIAVIRLNLPTIRSAYDGPDARRPDGWTPFEGLNADERFAEVLGHELAHAAKAFRDPEYWRSYLELETESNGLAFGNGGLTDDAGNDRRLVRIAALTQRIEEPARAAEAQVWRELARRR